MSSKVQMLATSGPTPQLGALRPPTTLVADCVHGDVLAWRRLHREYCQVVVAFLRRLGVAETDLDDASQEVFLQLFRCLSQFRGDADLKTWIYRLCATQATRVHRRKVVLVRLTTWFSLATRNDASPCPSDDVVVARSVLDRAMGKLTDKERLVFVLFELEGLSGNEVAEVLRVPVNTVWRRLFDARARLRTVIEQDDL